MPIISLAHLILQFMPIESKGNATLPQIQINYSQFKNLTA